MFDLTIWPYDSDAATCFSDVMSFLERKDDSRAFLSDSAVSYRDDRLENWQERLEYSHSLADEYGLRYETVSFLFFVNLLDEAWKKYRKEHLSDELFVSTFDDLRVKNDECFQLYGVFGSFVSRWFPAFFTLERFGFGRLEAEIRPFKLDCPLAAGTQVINIHIPSGRSLDEKACQESYEKAADFFSLRTFVCDSWLLNPANDRLDENSRIRRFKSRYDVLTVFEDRENSDAWRIFGREDISAPAGLSEDTGLKRLYKELLLEGKTIDRGYGMFRLK